jgi:NAD(P)H-quinone oxidoreductase subunit 5
VGIIVVEIAIGWYTLAFVHLAGHACFRLLQFLSAPNVLHDLHGLEDAMGEHVSAAGSPSTRLRAQPRSGLFLIALERGFLDVTLDRFIVDPFRRLAGLLTRVDRWLCLQGVDRASAAAEAVMPTRPAADGGAGGGDRDD